MAYGSAEEAVIKVTNALNVNLCSEDIEISHCIQRKHREVIIVKFTSHKIKSCVYKARTGLKNMDDGWKNLCQDFSIGPSY